MPLCNDVIKNREIRFMLSTPDQAEKAMHLLGDVEGIEHMEVTQANNLQICYSVEKLTLQMIENALRKVGFELDDSLVTVIKRAVFSYCEDALRASLGVDHEGEQKRDLSLPTQLLQDPRPDDWRNYV